MPYLIVVGDGLQRDINSTNERGSENLSGLSSSGYCQAIQGWSRPSVIFRNRRFCMTTRDKIEKRTEPFMKASHFFVTKSKATQCQRRIPPQSSGIQRIDWLDCSEAAHIGLLSHQNQKNQHIAAPFKRRPTFVLVDRIPSICHIACNIRIVDIKDPLEEFLSLPISQTSRRPFLDTVFTNFPFSKHIHNITATYTSVLNNGAG